MDENIILEKELKSKIEKIIYLKLKKKILVGEVNPIKKKLNFLNSKIKRLEKIIDNNLREEKLNKRILKKIREVIRDDPKKSIKDLDERILKKIQEIMGDDPKKSIKDLDKRILKKIQEVIRDDFNRTKDKLDLNLLDKRWRIKINN